MKLVTELIESVDVRIQIDEETKQKSHFIEGVFLQAEMKNRNGRMYPMSTMQKEVNRYNEQYIQKNRDNKDIGIFYKIDTKEYQVMLTYCKPVKEKND